MALRADAAPAPHRALTEQVDISVATGKVLVVTIALRELPRHRQTAQRPQQRVLVETGGDFTLHVRPEDSLADPAHRPLRLHLARPFNHAAVAGQGYVDKPPTARILNTGTQHHPPTDK